MQGAGCDLAALAYVRRMRRMNLMGRADASGASPAGQPSALAGLAGQSHLLNWADKTFGQGLTSLTKGNDPALHINLLDLPLLPFHLPLHRRGPISLRHCIFHSPVRSCMVSHPGILRCLRSRSCKV